MSNRILLSKGNKSLCPQTEEEVLDTVQQFRSSILADYTYQVRRGNPNAPMGFDFPIEKMRELVNNPSCEKIRILFSIDDGEAEGNGFLSVVIFGSGIGDVPLFNNAVFECCGEPPTTT